MHDRHPMSRLNSLFAYLVQPFIQRQALRFAGLMLLGFLISWAGGVGAQGTQPENSPPADADAPPSEQTAPDATAAPSEAELQQLLSQIDAAASQGDLQTVMSFYSPEFTNSDGLTYETLQQALQDFWERFPNVTYETTLNSWEAEGNSLVAETTTTITGTSSQETPTNLTATITSRQRFENGQIVEQEILDEASQLTQGENPPKVEVILPEQVTIGQTFEFDAIVEEPLGDRLLLGAAVEQSVQPDAYLNPAPVNLELLSSGGLFKLGQAPATPDTQWISAILIRDDGITTITRRLQVVNPNSASQ